MNRLRLSSLAIGVAVFLAACGSPPNLRPQDKSPAIRSLAKQKAPDQNKLPIILSDPLTPDPEKALDNYRKILELAPDEARILLLLLRGGPQPSVDVRTGGPVGMVSSSLVAPGMSMIGARSGCRYLDEVPAYLNNLFRLGLIWFSREQLEDPMEYQVVEAQPDVLEAMHSVRFPKVVRRSIHLTPFGISFCQACLVDPEETPTLPVHQNPEE